MLCLVNIRSYKHPLAGSLDYSTAATVSHYRKQSSNLGVSLQHYATRNKDHVTTVLALVSSDLKFIFV